MFAETDTLEYINISSFKINKEKTDFDWIFGNTYVKLKICLTDLQTQHILTSMIKNFDCSEDCFSKIFKYDLKDNTCIEYCNESEYKYEYNNFCYDKCPNATYVKDDNEYFCLNKTEEDNYYYDIEKGVFKECYKTCGKCNGKGNEINNNCNECKTSFIFLNESLNEVNNCYNECPYYYYFDEFNNYSCTDNETCPNNFDKLILEKKKCIDECKQDDIYQ